MSKKLNLRPIVNKHLATLRDNRTGNISLLDFFVFLVAPLGLSILWAVFNPVLSSEFLSLVVNFGAIITALLMSVVVLVYEQESKLKSVSYQDTSLESDRETKLKLFKELYQNICFTIVASLFVVVFSFMEMGLKQVGQCGIWYWLVFVLTVLVLLFFINVVLTIFMVVKRFHTLLTN